MSSSGTSIARMGQNLLKGNVRGAFPAAARYMPDSWMPGMPDPMNVEPYTKANEALNRATNAQ
jgi:hypothetical protein